MKNFILPFILGAVVTFLVMQGCEACKGTTSNATQNINRVDSLEIIRQAQAPLKGQIAQNETIIADLAKTVDELRAKAAQGNAQAGKLAEIIERQKAALEKERLKLESLTVLLSETQAKFSTPIKIEEGVGDEIGEDLTKFSTDYTDPDNWFSLTGSFDLATEKADYSLLVRNEFIISDFTTSEGVAKFRVESRNPYSYVLPGTNVFQVPIVRDKPRQRRIGLGIVGGAFAVRDFWTGDVSLGYGLGGGVFYRIL